MHTERRLFSIRGLFTVHFIVIIFLNATIKESVTLLDQVETVTTVSMIVRAVFIEMLFMFFSVSPFDL